ncbi:MAG: C39 family peptidase [Candidatus Paceibacterota bacterium]
MVKNVKINVWPIIIIVLFFGSSWFYLAGFEFPWRGDKPPVSLPAFSKTPTTTPTTTIRTTSSPKVSPKATILFNVPFAPQAPFGEWSDDRQQDGCEEASAMMAMHWIKGDTSITLEEAKREILAIADWQQAEYGNYHDTSIEDTVKRIFNKYYNYNNVRAEKNITADDIIKELEKGNLVIVPADGIALNNPHFTPPGPERHMLVIVGYDYSKAEFITNDPGTKFGKSYRYGKDALFGAIRDYPTGDHLPIVGRGKNMIVVEK